VTSLRSINISRLAYILLNRAKQSRSSSVHLARWTEIIRGGGEDTTFEVKAKDSEKVRGQG